MEQVPPTSFVPRPPTGPVVAAAPRRTRRLNLLSFFAVIVFFGSIFTAGGVFVLKKMSDETLKAKREELSNKQTFLKKEDIESVQLLDARIKAATAVLDTHVSPSKLLEKLEATTQEEVQFTEFEFTRRSSGNIGVRMDGLAPRFNTVAAQAERFGEEDMFRRVMFADLNKNPDPEFVTFSVTLDIAGKELAYEVDPSTLQSTIPSTATESVPSVSEEAVQATTTEQPASTEAL